MCIRDSTKDVVGYMRPLAPHVRSLIAVPIPGAEATLPAEATEQAAIHAGMVATTAPDTLDAVRRIALEEPGARILICGSLYLAGEILRDNG